MLTESEVATMQYANQVLALIGLPILNEQEFEVGCALAARCQDDAVEGRR